MAISGCGTAITSDTTLQQLLDQLGLGQMKVSDILSGLGQLAGGVSNGGGFGFAALSLTSEQTAQLTDLRNQLDAGQITQDDFAKQVRAIVGDGAPAFAFGDMGFGGGPMGMGGSPADLLASALGLTDDQKTQAQDVFDRFQADLQGLQSDARGKFDAALTDAQRQQLTDLRNEHSASFGRPIGFGGPGGFGGFGGAPSGGGPFGLGPHGPLGGGWTSGGNGIADQLGLSDEQRAQTAQIQDDLKLALEARRQTADDELRKILTADQAAQFDTLQSQFTDPEAASGNP
jgi:Spy/CpxP family protein refolding chaperone